MFCVTFLAYSWTLKLFRTTCVWSSRCWPLFMSRTHAHTHTYLRCAFMFIQICYLSFLFAYVLKPFQTKFITKTLKLVDTFRCLRPLYARLVRLLARCLSVHVRSSTCDKINEETRQRKLIFTYVNKTQMYSAKENILWRYRKHNNEHAHWEKPVCLYVKFLCFFLIFGRFESNNN